MSENLDRYHRRRAKEELAGELWQPLLFTTGGTIMLLWVGFQGFPAPLGLVQLGVGLVLGVCTVGLIGHHEWARRLAVWIFAGMFLFGVALAFQEGWRWGHLRLLLIVMIVVSLSSKETREHFAWSRGERTSSEGPPP